QHAGAAARLEDAPHREARVRGEGGDEAGTRAHLVARRDRGARIEVVAPVVVAIEARLAARPGVTRRRRSASDPAPRRAHEAVSRKMRVVNASKSLSRGSTPKAAGGAEARREARNASHERGAPCTMKSAAW